MLPCQYAIPRTLILYLTPGRFWKWDSSVQDMPKRGVKSNPNASLRRNKELSSFILRPVMRRRSTLQVRALEFRRLGDARQYVDSIMSSAKVMTSSRGASIFSLDQLKGGQWTTERPESGLVKEVVPRSFSHETGFHYCTSRELSTS